MPQERGRSQWKLPQEPIPRSAFHYEDDSSLHAPAQCDTRRAIKETSQGFQSTYSNPQPFTNGQDGSSLVSYIEANNTLPVNWNLFKRGRLSEGDITDLQERLELDHNLRQTEPRRPSELDPSTLIGGDLQRQYDGTSKFTRLDMTLRSSSFFRQWPQDTIRTLSAYITSCQERIADQLSGCPQWLCDSVSVIFKGMFRFLHDCTMTAGQAWSWAWPIVRWPLVILVTFLIALNTIAFAYTVTPEAFLSNFCVKELPLVRNWMCSAWDKRLQPGSVEGTGRFLDPLETILLRNGSTSSYILPHILGRYETIVRSFRVNLPVSQFSAIDQDDLREQFTKFIDQSGVTIQSSQEFHSHMMGTISRSVSNTQYYIDKISEYNLTWFPLSEKTFEINFEADDSLSKSMAWFNSHYMVFLPAGLEPFRQRVVRIPYAESVYGLQRHVAAMADRLAIDIDLALTLKAQMQDQREIGEKVEERVALSRSANNVKLAQRSNWRFLVEHLLWKSLASYQVEQRAQWLEVMALAFDEHRLFLDGAIIDMETARVECNSLSVRLLEEAGQVTSGWAMTDWAIHETRILKEGADNLEDLLKSFQLEQRRFHAAQFRNAI